MKVLTSSTAFNDHYADPNRRAAALAAAGLGLGTTATLMAAGAAAAGTAAAGASAWTLGAGLPLVGGWCAAHASAVGVAAGTAALTSAAVLAPALIAGGGLAFLAYRRKWNRALQKGSGVSALAHAFAGVAFLPMMALAVTTCQTHPEKAEYLRDRILKETGAWGYAESYVRERFEEAMKSSSSELDRRYSQKLELLKRGSTEGIGATPEELPVNVVQAFAENFKRDLQSCIEY